MTGRLIRRETRGDLPLLACLAVLVLVLAALCAWAPALAGRQEDRALRQRVQAAQAQGPLISVSTTFAVFHNTPESISMGALLGDGRSLTGGLGAPAARRLAPAGGTYDYSQASLSAPRPPDPAVTSTRLALSYLPAAQGHLRYVAGRPPADRTPPGAPPQIALSQATAQALGVRAGSRLDAGFAATPGLLDEPPHAAFLVSGVYLPAAADGFWTGRESLDQPSRAPEERSAGTVLSVRGLVGLDTADVLSRAGVRGPLVTWQFRPDLSGAALDEARNLTGPLSHFGADLNAALCQGYGVDETTGDVICRVGAQATDSLLVVDALTPLLSAFTAQDQQARALATFAVDALAAVVLATVVVAVRLLLMRRRAHLRLQRARGASTTRLVLVRCAVAWTVVPVAALSGWALGRALAPAGTSGSPQPLPAVAAAAVVAAVVPLMTWLAVREPRRRGRVRRLGRRAAGARRVVLELTVLLAAAAGVAALRAQGPDGILGAVPALVALAVVLLLLRLSPSSCASCCAGPAAAVAPWASSARPAPPTTPRRRAWRCSSWS